ncbi:MFS transporter [Lichenihabitans sp. Uapishka_5]|uniref:MFS transporter n=1 Tax=Lichenihabitans sp. Uapishka_5 TaxID=3037302 RepID=UPI0029E7EB95|nr:MFS transporter [Lichenihabitans sp. Uapishka_5]MDX7950739.1 MFS transporter [Lichenihabitans sp. Uapishka_5]
MPAASSLAALLISVFVLITGNGVLNTLVPLRTKLDGFPELAIGLVGSAYFGGMLLGSFLSAAVLRRLGAKFAFVVFAGMTIVSAILFPLAESPLSWMALRALLGFAFAGLYAVLEAWLNARSNNSNRGGVYALYQMVTFGGSAAGQEIIATMKPQADVLFAIAALCLAAAIVPILLTRGSVPRVSRSVSLQLRWMARLSPIGTVSAACIGAANGNFYALAPVYGLGLGLSSAHVATFMTATIMGTALAVYPVARLSDGHDRRLVLTVFSAIGILAESMLAMTSHGSMLLISCLGLSIGASTMVLYTVAISHVNDRAGPDNGVEVSSTMLFLYCVGAIVGPAVGSVGMAWFGPAALFVQNAAVHAALVGFTVWHLVCRDGWMPVLPRLRRPLGRLRA